MISHTSDSDRSLLRHFSSKDLLKKTRGTRQHRKPAASKMVTGVWSKRINEANERSGQSMNSAGMVAGMTTLCFVIGLGFRMKLQMIRNFAGELYDVVHGDRVRMAQEAVRRGATPRHFDPKHGFRTQSTQHEAGQHDSSVDSSTSTSNSNSNSNRSSNDGGSKNSRPIGGMPTSGESKRGRTRPRRTYWIATGRSSASMPVRPRASSKRRTTLPRNGTIQMPAAARPRGPRPARSSRSSSWRTTHYVGGPQAFRPSDVLDLDQHG